MPIEFRKDGVKMSEVKVAKIFLDGGKNKLHNFYVCPVCCHELKLDYHDQFVHIRTEERNSCSCNCQRSFYSPLIYKDKTKLMFYRILEKLEEMNVESRCGLVKPLLEFENGVLKGVVPS